jgi:anti-sigma regulatory factor (Ser/Thr protein kinase)/anti-anti-sigma regulatory factor
MDTLTEQGDLEFVTSLQTVVQQAGVPVLPFVDLDGRFRVPSDAVEPGGTFFDVVVLPDDRVALIVGEVPGIGMPAAIMAAQVRAVLRAGLRRDADVLEALQLADVHAEDVGEARGTAAVVAVVDPERGLVTYATAGHAPPLLLPASGTGEPLASTGGGLLGTGTGTGYAATTCPLGPGDVVLLVSAAAHRAGALVLPEAPGDAAAAAFDDLTAVGASILARLAADDTLCILAARRRAEAHPDLRARVPRGESPVRQARHELSSWLEGLRASPIDQMAVVHAAAELVTNAVDHGGEEDHAPIELQGRLGSDGVVRIEVLDHGSWQPPSEDLERGRGLAMAAGLVDHLGVSVGPFGTRALLQHRLLRPVAIDSSTSSGQPEPASPVEVVHSAPHVVSLKGYFGHDDVERVAAEILVAARGGTIGLALDLTEVTELSTSAVRLLVDLTSVNRAVGMFTADLAISAAEGSTAERTLDIAGVPHRAV